MMTTLLLIFILSFFAFSIGAISGGGGGLMLIPLLERVLPISQVPGALSIGTFTNAASRLIVFRKSICWYIVVYFVPFSLPAVGFGAWLLNFVNPVYLKIAIALFLISNAVFLFQKPNEIGKNVKKPKNSSLALIGFLAGFLSGLTGAVGLIFNRFYLRYGLTKEEIVATRAANEIILHFIKIIFYFIFGLITLKVIYIGIVIAFSAILSAWTMKWMLPKVSETAFKKIAYLTMVISGFIMLFQSGSELLTNNNTRGISVLLDLQSRNLPFFWIYNPDSN